LCSAWDSNNRCTNCSKGSFLNRNNICTLVDPLCLTHNPQNGDCLSCFIGYTLNAGRCVVSNQTAVVDPFCKKFMS